MSGIIILYTQLSHYIRNNERDMQHVTDVLWKRLTEFNSFFFNIVFHKFLSVQCK